MKAYRIERDRSVTALDTPVEDWMTDDVDWEALPLPSGDDLYVDGEAFSSPGLILARVGPHARVPLPAYVIGADGEEPADVKIGRDELEALIE